MHEENLHDLVRSYRAGAESKERFMERVSTLLYEEPGRYGFDDEDAAADALERHGRRIAALPDRFEERGISFEAYLRSNLRFLARTVRRERRRLRERELVCERAVSEIVDTAWGLSGGIRGEPGVGGGRAKLASRPTPPVPPTPGSRSLADSVSAAYASRLVFLALKCAWYVDDEIADRVSEFAGVEREWFGSALAQARRSLESERGRFERMEVRRNRSWCRIRLLEGRLKQETDEATILQQRQALERERGRLARARDEIRAFKPLVPNSIVARILGVPKGTVDSGLYYLKKRSGAHRLGTDVPDAGAGDLGTSRPVAKRVLLAARSGSRVSSRHGTLRSYEQRP